MKLKFAFYYKYYLETSIIYTPLGGSGIVAILILILYMIAITKCNYREFSKEKKILFNVGVLTYGVSLILEESLILNRILEYVILAKVFPILYLIEELNHTKLKKIIKMLILALFFIIFLKKIFYFPTKEYVYKSIILK